METYEEGQLNWARVLELVDDQQLEPLFQLPLNVGMLNERKRSVQHVYEVNNATALLPSIVEVQSAPGGFVNASRELAQPTVKTRMVVHSCRDLVQCADRTERRLTGLDQLESQPVAPVQRSGLS